MTKLEKLSEEKVDEFKDKLGYILSTKEILKAKYLASHSHIYMIRYID